MDVTPLIRRDAKVIQSYRGGSFKISGQVYTTPVLVMPDLVMTWSKANAELTRADFDVLRPYQDRIDILLIGTGNKMQMPAVDLRREIKASFGITPEAMDTGAASRTYNVLLTEGRKVAVLLALFS